MLNHKYFPLIKSMKECGCVNGQAEKTYCRNSVWYPSTMPDAGVNYPRFCLFRQEMQ